jgi:hypothetical protein
MAYTRPSASAADATWQGAAPYTRPSASAADATFVESSGVDCTIAASLAITASLAVSFGSVEIGSSIASVVPITASISADHGVAADIHAVLTVAAASGVAHGVAGSVGAAVGIAGAFDITHERYEVRGVTQIGGVLVDRRVRVYLRETGALIAQGDTVAGAFHLATGFSAGGGEVYVIPIDLSGGATDWTPPIANRVVPTLAMDT